jgi:putative two-component system response regulator
MNPAILLVDVSSVNREELKSFLQARKYNVGTAADGQSALACCLLMQPDLVLLYDSLPDISSFDLCRQIKKDPLFQLTPVVLLKPSPGLSDVQRGQDAGAMNIWANPVSHWDALGRIETLLRLKRYMDEQAKSAVLALARSIDSVQNMRNGHSERLVAYVEQLGVSFRLADGDLHELRLACWLHDVGKINMPESILLKPGPLDAEERRIMQEHPIMGEQICAPLKPLRKILPVIRHHHEKMDGSGYPDGLRGEAIPLKARILQVADIFDALTTNRPYRGALPPEEALQIIFSEAQKGWLDSSVVSKFSQICRHSEYFPVRERTMLASYYGRMAQPENPKAILGGRVADAYFL